MGKGKYMCAEAGLLVRTLGSFAASEVFLVKMLHYSEQFHSFVLAFAKKNLSAL